MSTMTKMMRCHEAMGRLWEFLDGEMPVEDRRALERHLEVCGRCFPAYDFQRAYLEYTQNLAAQAVPPPELRRRLFQALLEMDAEGSS